MSIRSLQAYSEIQNPVIYVQSDPLTMYTDAILPNAQDVEEWSNVLLVPRVNIVGLQIVSEQNLPWLVWFYNALAPGGVALDWFGYLAFNPTAGRQVNGAGPYLYSIYQQLGLAATTPFPIPYRAGVTLGGEETKLYIGLQVDGGAVAKIAGVGGTVSLKLMYQPMGE